MSKKIKLLKVDPTKVKKTYEGVDEPTVWQKIVNGLKNKR